ncbi:glycosyltransferase [Brumimicrobium sp.]|uniref:glycosyltransferase n=1 Tax=Brumimicrobium sp. TaxID=2029867 RepID=UPI003A8D11A7
MKIAVLSTFYPYRGGIAQFNAALYRAIERKYEVKAFNFSLQYPKAMFPGKTQLVTADDKVDEIPTVRVLNAMNPATYMTTVKRIREFEPDVLVIGYWMPYMAPALGYVAKKMSKHCRVVSIVHNATPHEQGKLDRTLSNYFFNRNSHCIALSNAVNKEIKENYPRVKSKVLLHPVYDHFGNVVDRTEAAEKLNLNPDKKYLLFFGLIRDYKGLDQLLLSMKDLEEDIHLIVAGEVYGSFEQYDEIIKSHQLEDRVHLNLEYISDEMVKYYFSLTSVVVLPYKSGTQSGIIAIAKHFNKPVVATDVGGLSEFIQDETEGMIVPPNNVLELSKGIEKMLNSVHITTTDQPSTYNWDDFVEDMLEFMIEE